MVKTEKFDVSPEDKERMKKYLRGSSTSAKRIKDVKLKKQIQRSDLKHQEAAKKAADAEILLTEERGFLEAEGLEKTSRFKQEQIQKHLDITTAKKSFNLKLDHFGPYAVDYTRNGRWLLIGGRKGHVASFDWKTGALGAEIHLGETVRDIKWLHNEMMFAAAQKRYVYIYDHTGAELHCIKNHMDVRKLEFLPYHFLLASIGDTGFLRYHDTSTGSIVAEHRTGKGRCDVMRQNPWNGIINLGHTDGTVTLWSPNMTSPHVKMLCHRGPVSALAIDQGGYYMATAGMDGRMKLWDIRKYEPLYEHQMKKSVNSLTISQQGLLACGFGSHVQIWKDALKTRQEYPYMEHFQPSDNVNDLEFCPFDDVLAVGHANGISSLIIPGAGEPNFDALEANPFQTKKQRQEAEVHALLEKIQPDMITLNPHDIGGVSKFSNVPTEDSQDTKKSPINVSTKHKTRGKSSAAKKFKRKQNAVTSARREDMKTYQIKDAGSIDTGTDHGNNQEGAGGEARLAYAMKRFLKTKK